MILSNTTNMMLYRQTSVDGIRLLLLLNSGGGNRLNASTTSSSSSSGTTTTRATARNSKMIVDNNDKPVVDELQQEQQTAQQKEQNAMGNGCEEPVEAVAVGHLQLFCERAKQHRLQGFAELLDKNNRNLLLPIGQLDSRLAKLEASVMLMGQQQLSAAGNAGIFDGEWRPSRFVRLFVWLFNRALVIVVCILLLDNIFDEKEPKQSLLYKLSLLPASYKKTVMEWYNSARKEKQSKVPNVRLASVVGNSLNGDAGKCSAELLILADGVTVVNRAADKNTSTKIRAKLPFAMPSSSFLSTKDGSSNNIVEHTIFYYEIRVIKNNGNLTLGLTGELGFVNALTDFIESAFSTASSMNTFCDYTPKRGDVFGYGLVVTKAAAGQARRVFFTRNGKICCEPMWLPASTDKMKQLYPAISLQGQGTAVEVNLGPESAGGKPFRYNLAKHPGLELEK